MAAPLNRPRCTVTLPDGTVYAHSTTRPIALRSPAGRTVATILSGATTLLEKNGKVAVTPTSGSSWTVAFDDGEVWEIRDAKGGCGCG